MTVKFDNQGTHDSSTSQRRSGNLAFSDLLIAIAKIDVVRLSESSRSHLSISVRVRSLPHLPKLLQVTHIAYIL